MSRKREGDWFACPVCGAEVAAGALACRECGSDAETGWSEDTLYDDLDLPEPDLPDTFEDFERLTRKPRRHLLGVPWPVVLVALAVLAAALVVLNAIGVAVFGPWG